MQSNHTVNRSANQLGDVEIVLRRLARLHLSGSAVALACLLAERGPAHRVNMAEISRTLGVSRTALYRALGVLRSAGILNGDDRIIPEGATPGVTDQHNGEVQPQGSQMQPRGERNPCVDSVTHGVAQPPGLHGRNPRGYRCNPTRASEDLREEKKQQQTRENFILSLEGRESPQAERDPRYSRNRSREEIAEDASIPVAERVAMMFGEWEDEHGGAETCAVNQAKSWIKGQSDSAVIAAAWKALRVAPQNTLNYFTSMCRDGLDDPDRIPVGGKRRRAPDDDSPPMFHITPEQRARRANVVYRRASEL